MKKLVGWLAVVLVVSGMLLGPAALAAEGGGLETSPAQHDAVRSIGLGVAAAIAVAVSILGSGYAVGKIGSAALGAAVEKPELLIRSLLFIALAEGLAVLGFAVAMMLIQKM